MHVCRLDFRTGIGKAFNPRKHVTIIFDRTESLDIFERRLKDYGIFVSNWIVTDTEATASEKSGK